MKEIKLIIFDMDGLMFDTEKIAFTSWKKAASYYNYEFDNEIFMKTLGSNYKRTKEIFLNYFGEQFPFDVIINKGIEIAEDLIKINGVPIKSGLVELLNSLKNLKLKKAVATSTSRNRALALLKKAGVDEYFDYVLCGDEIEKSKPNPEIFLKTADKLECLPENCLVLEDSEVGIKAAYNAGMLPIMIPDMKEPDQELKKLTFKQFNSLHDVKVFLEKNKTCSTVIME